MDSSFLSLLFWIISFAVAISVHESAHALAAYLLGDPTGKYAGRISLNPLRHVDPLGLIFLLIVHFGWAKPVPVDPRNFRSPRLGMALTALAGPLSNIVLAWLGLNILTFLPVSFVAGLTFFHIFFLLNVFLAVFNLLPLFPLDGEKILMLFIPRRWLPKYQQWSHYGPIILFALIGISQIFRIDILGAVLIPMAQYLGSFIELLVLF